MEEQYNRLLPLIGKDKFQILNDKKIIVFGLGGVGGYVVDALARCGIMNIAIVDNDIFNVTNLNRQLLANVNTIGRKKTEVTKEHILSINKDINVSIFDIFYLPGCQQINFDEYDYIVDAIDTVSSKIDIVLKCEELGKKHISALGCGNRLDPSKVVVTDLSKTKNDPLAKILRRELGKRNIRHSKICYSEESPIVANTEKGNLPSSIFVPSIAGITIAYEVIMDLLKNE